MSIYRYPVLAFRQQPQSPVQVAFVAPAGELVKWAGTPRKSDELLAGYQRFRDDERVDQKIVPFFSDPRNCSPTAIIVALRPDSGLGRCTLSVDKFPSGEVIQAELTIEIDDEQLKSDAIFKAALDYVGVRVAQDAAASAVGDSAANSDDEEQEESQESDEDAEAGEGDDEIVHLGSETLAEMQRLLADKKNWENKNFRTAIEDYVKPAFLIDGQHRAAAAARIGPNGLPFMICGLFDAHWAEQVFQFTIVNVKPKVSVR